MSWKAKFNYFDPETIMSVVVALIILGIGVFAFTVTMQNLPITTENNTNSNSTNYSMNFTEFFGPYQPIMSIFPVIIIIAAIGGIVHFVQRIAMGRESYSSDEKEDEEKPKIIEDESEEEEEIVEEKTCDTIKKLGQPPENLKTKLERRKKQLKEQQKQIEESKKGK